MLEICLLDQHLQGVVLGAVTHVVSSVQRLLVVSEQHLGGVVFVQVFNHVVHDFLQLLFLELFLRLSRSFHSVALDLLVFGGDSEVALNFGEAHTFVDFAQGGQGGTHLLEINIIHDTLPVDCNSQPGEGALFLLGTAQLTISFTHPLLWAELGQLHFD